MVSKCEACSSVAIVCCLACTGNGCIGASAGMARIVRHSWGFGIPEKFMLRPFLWNCMASDLKFHVMIPMLTNHGVPNMTSISLPMSSKRVSIWNVPLSTQRRTLKEVLVQAISSITHKHGCVDVAFHYCCKPGEVGIYDVMVCTAVD